MGSQTRDQVRYRIHARIRKRLSGTADRPRLAVFRSNKHIYAQLIDDVKGVTVAAAGSNEKDKGKSVVNGGNLEAAKTVGQLIGERAKGKGLSAVVFDRGGYLFHGRIRALAESAREAGLKF